MTEGVWMLVGAFALIFGILAAVTMVADWGSLDGIKSKNAGDGQHGTTADLENLYWDLREFFVTVKSPLSP